MERSSEEMKEKEESSSSTHLVEDIIAFPRVTQLHKIGAKFRPSKGGLGSINFDKSFGTFYLPIIHLDDNSEVVLRNLVAF